MSRPLDIALIQTRTPATADAALAHVEPLIRQAAAEGARFILTPEGTNLLEQRRDRRGLAITDEDQDVAVIGLRRLAAELGVWLLIGSAIVRSGHPGDDRAANRSLLIDAARHDHGRYDKLHVFDVDLPNGETYRESATIRPGRRCRPGPDAVGPAGDDRLLRSPFPAPVPAAGQGRGLHDLGPRRLHRARPVRPTGRRFCGPGPSRPAVSSWLRPRAGPTRTAARPGAGPPSSGPGAR